MSKLESVHKEVYREHEIEVFMAPVRKTQCLYHCSVDDVLFVLPFASFFSALNHAVAIVNLREGEND